VFKHNLTWVGTPHPTLGHSRGSLRSQSLDWYWQTKQYRKIHKLNTTQKTTQNTAKQNNLGWVAFHDIQSGKPGAFILQCCRTNPDGDT